MIDRAFTCTGPYAILIMLGLKHVENRHSNPFPSKGRCAVSCSKNFSKQEYGNFVQWASRALDEEDFSLIPSWNEVRNWPGKIVGCCDYAVRGRGDLCLGMENQERLWDEGLPFYWDLSEIVCISNPIPCRGFPEMWQLSGELSERVTQADDIAKEESKRIETASDAARFFRTAISIAGGNEGFFVLPLDMSNRPKSLPILVSLGIDSQTAAVQLKDVFAEVFKAESDRFIVAHNHPLGTLKPSKEDIKLTGIMKAASEAIGLKMLDHLIIGHCGAFSVVKPL